MQLFGGYQWEAFLQVKPHLVAKRADGAGAGTVTFRNTGIQNMLQKLVVLLHGRNV
jgi:hypothetical protein